MCSSSESIDDSGADKQVSHQEKNSKKKHLIIHMNSKMYHSPFQPNISQSIVSKRLAGLSHEELVWRLSVLECAVLMTEQSKQNQDPRNY